jgi:hypothetical protein
MEIKQLPIKCLPDFFPEYSYRRFNQNLWYA